MITYFSPALPLEFFIFEIEVLYGCQQAIPRFWADYAYFVKINIEFSVIYDTGEFQKKR